MEDSSQYLRALADILSPEQQLDAPAEERKEITTRVQKDIAKVRSLAYLDKLCPEVDFSFSQDLRVQDIFLPHSTRTPSSASCEWLIVKVKMPQEDGPTSEVKADVVGGNLIVDSKKYHLEFNLPQPPASDPNLHVAKWIADKRQLTVHVKLEREFDYMNF